MSFKQISGESAGIDNEALQNWQQNELQSSLQGFAADDIYNIDETGLFWQLLPNRTMAFKGDFSFFGTDS